MTKTAFALLVASVAVTGCADQIMSDRSIADSTAMALNQPASAVRITERRSDGISNTYYTALTPNGSYRCLITGGSLLFAGAANAPSCTR